MAAAFEHIIEYAVRAFHVYREVWTPILNQSLLTQQDLGNTEDQYAVSVIKEDSGTSQTVGHISNSWSCAKRTVKTMLVFHRE